MSALGRWTEVRVSAAQLVGGQFRKRAFFKCEPGRAGRGEVQHEPLMICQPNASPLVFCEWWRCRARRDSPTPAALRSRSSSRRLLAAVVASRDPITLAGRYFQDLWMGSFQATSVAVDSPSSVGVMSMARSSSLPLWNKAPARTRATRRGALTARQRVCAASMSL